MANPAKETFDIDTIGGDAFNLFVNDESMPGTYARESEATEALTELLLGNPGAVVEARRQTIIRGVQRIVTAPPVDPPVVPPVIPPVPPSAGFKRWRTLDMETPVGSGGAKYVKDSTGSTVARYDFPAGASGSGQPAYFNVGFGPGEVTPRLRVEYDFEYSPNAAESPGSACKHFYAVSPQFGNIFYVSWKGANSIELCTQEMGPPKNWPQNKGTPNAPRGKKNHAILELHGNGAVKFWMNGVLTHDYPAGTLWSASLGVTFYRVNFDSVPGGGTTQPWWLQFDNVWIDRAA